MLRPGSEDASPAGWRRWCTLPRMGRAHLFAVGLVAATAHASPPAASTTPVEEHLEAPSEGVPNSLPPRPSDPLDERVRALHEAAELLTHAAQARQRGQAWFAEQLFSAAELLVGPAALAQLAPLFRSQTPERISSPLTHYGPEAPVQPALAGTSDEDAPSVERQALGVVSGIVRLDGKARADAAGVVMLDPLTAPPREPRPRRRVMEQRDRRFRPHILVVPVGSTVVFPNFDPIYHNVFSRSTARPFDLGLFKNGDAREVVFDQPGIVKLGCNLHLNMSGYIVIVKSPYYAVTDEQGRFTINAVPPGRYLLRAWNESRAEMVTQRVDVTPERNEVVVHLRASPIPDTIVDKFGALRSSK